MVGLMDYERGRTEGRFIRYFSAVTLALRTKREFLLVLDSFFARGGL